MEINEYQRACHKTAVYPEDKAIEYLVLGLVSEAGEVAQVIKKAIRSGTPISPIRVMEETGDVLWYVAELLAKFNIPLDSAMKYNISKLNDRSQAGTLKERQDVTPCQSLQP